MLESNATPEEVEVATTGTEDKSQVSADTGDAPDPQAELEAMNVAQGLPEGSIPETRPQAFAQLAPEEAKSELTKRLEEENPPPEPVSAEDLIKAKEAGDKAAAKGKEPDPATIEGAHAGSVVKATKGPHEGRIFAVLRVMEEGSVGDMIRRLSGNPEAGFNTPKTLELRALGDERDGEYLVLDAEENGLQKLNESFRGSRAGRLH